mmetsp:Transcript_39229/g.92664  ORF Transcript_39229/g.92664 Transcript_39229/m.92664 type:complete len:410 (-) Transcript_39229:1787-3016(-)
MRLHRLMRLHRCEVLDEQRPFRLLRGSPELGGTQRAERSFCLRGCVRLGGVPAVADDLQDRVVAHLQLLDQRFREHGNHRILALLLTPCPPGCASRTPRGCGGFALKLLLFLNRLGSLLVVRHRMPPAVKPDEADRVHGELLGVVLRAGYEPLDIGDAPDDLPTSSHARLPLRTLHHEIHLRPHRLALVDARLADTRLKERVVPVRVLVPPVEVAVAEVGFHQADAGVAFVEEAEHHVRFRHLLAEEFDALFGSWELDAQPHAERLLVCHHIPGHLVDRLELDGHPPFWGHYLEVAVDGGSVGAFFGHLAQLAHRVLPPREIRVTVGPAEEFHAGRQRHVDLLALALGDRLKEEVLESDSMRHQKCLRHHPVTYPLHEIRHHRGLPPVEHRHHQLVEPHGSHDHPLLQE